MNAAASRLPETPIRAGLSPARIAMGVFFLQAIILNSWFPRIPDVQSALGLSAAQLGIALIGFPLGGFIGTALAASIVEPFTPRRTLIIGTFVYAAMAVLPGWAWSLPSLCVILFFCGLSYVVIDVAANVEATRIQTALGKRILSTCHGFWSLGSVVGLVTSAGFAQAGVDVRVHLLIASLAIAPMIVALAARLPQFAVPPRAAVQRPPLVALPVAGMAGLCVFAFSAIVAELTTRNWGAVFVRETLAATPFISGITYGAFALGMTGMRLVGDRLTDRFGPVALGRFSGAMMVVGVLALAVTSNIPLAVIGFTAIGMGAAVCMPLAITTAAHFGGGRTAAVNVAAVSLMAYTGSLIGPPLVGLVADAWGLRWGFATILPLVAVALLFAGSLRVRAT